MFFLTIKKSYLINAIKTINPGKYISVGIISFIIYYIISTLTSVLIFVKLDMSYYLIILIMISEASILIDLICRGILYVLYKEHLGRFMGYEIIFALGFVNFISLLFFKFNFGLTFINNYKTSGYVLNDIITIIFKIFIHVYVISIFVKLRVSNKVSEKENND